MITLPKFLYCENKTELKSAGIILCTQPPFFTGNIIKAYKLPSNFHPSRECLVQVQIPGYAIGIVIEKSLQNDLIPDFITIYEYLKSRKVLSLAHEMAEFYHTEKIKPNLNYFKRYVT